MLPEALVKLRETRTSIMLIPGPGRRRLNKHPHSSLLVDTMECFIHLEDNHRLRISANKRVFGERTVIPGDFSQKGRIGMHDERLRRSSHCVCDKIKPTKFPVP